MTDWILCREEWEEHRRMVARLHDVIVGSPESPGYLEIQRRQIDRIDRHDKRLSYHQLAIEKVEGEINELKEAPVKAAAAELAGLKADNKDLRKTIGRKALDVAVQGFVAAVVAIGAVLGAAWSGLLRLAQNLPPGPTPHP